MYKFQLLSVLFVLAIVSISLGQLTQLQNLGFELWEDVGLNINEPVDWSSIKTFDNSFLNGIGALCLG